MRENKFKVWCKDKNEWEKDECVLDQYGEVLHLVHGQYRNTAMRIYPDKHIPVFYTGLKDKNGKEIYEGDILRHTNQICEVFYSTDWCSFRLKNEFYGSPMSNDEDFIYEVIGNIYENPELLK